MKRVVFRGDDASSYIEANEAFEQAALKGVLRNASVMACGPALAARRLAGIPGLREALSVVADREGISMRRFSLAGDPVDGKILRLRQRRLFPVKATPLQTTNLTAHGFTKRLLENGGIGFHHPNGALLLLPDMDPNENVITYHYGAARMEVADYGIMTREVFELALLQAAHRLPTPA